MVTVRFIGATGLLADVPRPVECRANLRVLGIIPYVSMFHSHPVCVWIQKSLSAILPSSIPASTPRTH
jgi:hypothetical protein